MGYYTDHHLTIELGDKNLLDTDQFNDDFEQVTQYALSSIQCEAIKWYDSDDHMLTLSTIYPNVVFRLEGTGEDSDDQWIVYYYNGHKQDAHMRHVWDPFDISTGNMAINHPELLI